MMERNPQSSTLVLGFPEYAQQATNLAEHLRLPIETVGVHRFPDRESLITLPPKLPPRVILVRSLDRPNDKLVDLLIAAATARELGARHLTLVAPYLCYMRQDKAFHPGEGVSQRVVGALLATMCDALITVDPHLHRVRRLEDAVPVRPALALSAATLLGKCLCGRVSQPILLGPDEESAQWVERLARAGNLEHTVARKTRLGDRRVEVELPKRDWRGRQVVLVDDVASTGQTLTAATRLLLEAGAKDVFGLVTHALFVQGAERRMRDAGLASVWSTDSIPHGSNCIALAPLLAEGVLSTQSQPPSIRHV